eukprot:GILJ01008957.1.p1 GENE.GILJ01008957.1~~GILJ01008957.1.p1  ORF type:complete len:437 (+),score=79.75 GILJ01008957.1:82-1392(+)
MATALVLGSGALAASMAWAIGAQDVSNALGTSVGSKALTVNQAVIVAAIFEFLGSTLGGSVSQTISDGIIDSSIFEEYEFLILAMFCTLGGAFIWLLIATFVSAPVSTTHSLVGSLVGVGLLVGSSKAVKFHSLLKIVSSWLTSPLLGGLVSYIIYRYIYQRILRAKRPAEQAIRYQPLFVGFTVWVLVVFLLQNGPKHLQLSFSNAALCGLVSAGIVAMAIRSNQSSVQRWFKTKNDVDLEAESIELRADDEESDKHYELAEAESHFSMLMVATACVVALAHGANDVSNSVGPFIAILNAYQTQSTKAVSTGTPLWVLVCGGIGIVLGLATYGYKVMKTVGEQITVLTFSKGFAAQIGTAVTVLFATTLGLTVSTTHCIIGAITGVALVTGTTAINVHTLKRIAMSWVVTIPVSMFASVCLYKILHPFVNRSIVD